MEKTTEELTNEASLIAAADAATDARIPTRLELLGLGPEAAILTLGSVLILEPQPPLITERRASAKMHYAAQINRTFAALLCRKLSDHFGLTAEELAAAIPNAQ